MPNGGGVAVVGVRERTFPGVRSGRAAGDGVLRVLEGRECSAVVLVAVLGDGEHLRHAGVGRAGDGDVAVACGGRGILVGADVETGSGERCREPCRSIVGHFCRERPGILGRDVVVHRALRVAYRAVVRCFDDDLCLHAQGEHAQHDHHPNSFRKVKLCHIKFVSLLHYK